MFLGAELSFKISDNQSIVLDENDIRGTSENLPNNKKTTDSE